MIFGQIAVTGAFGFLGSHLVERARKDGTDVLAIVRELPSAQAAHARGTITMDALLNDPSRLGGTDVLVHSAAIRHRYGANPSAYRASNVDLVEVLMRAAAGRVGRFVFVSSVGVYGFPALLPVHEQSLFAPRTLYSQTKIEAEKLVRKLAPELGLPFTIVRPTIIYGAGDRNGMLDKLAAMIRSRRYLIVGSGNNELHHTHIDDVVEGTLWLSGSDAAKGEDFILAGPETITLRRLSELVAKAVGISLTPLHVPTSVARAVATGVDLLAYRGVAFTKREPPINNDKLDVMTVPIAFDASKAWRAGFSPVVRYDDGIARTFASAQVRRTRVARGVNER
ncbi:MAG: NAD(P)-dependent oxidoreductase [Polyangiaceae bacterium]|nr:NAD(P)-dependent oxidoreductase [Polyangiaceae bacterium]